MGQERRLLVAWWSFSMGAKVTHSGYYVQRESAGGIAARQSKKPRCAEWFCVRPTLVTASHGLDAKSGR
jgi:hypothetical protein